MTSGEINERRAERHWLRCSEVLYLYRARLRARAVRVQEGMAVIGIAVGVALLFASHVAGTSLSRSVAQLTGEIVGRSQFQLAGRGPTGFSERVLTQVRGVPGVKEALPVVEQQANVIGRSGQQSVELIGVPPQFKSLAGSLLPRLSAKQLESQQAIALPVPIAESIGASVGPVTLEIGGSRQSVLLGLTLSESEVGALVHSPVALAPVRYAQALTSLSGRLNRIFIHVQPARAHEVAAALARIAAAANMDLQPASHEASVFAVAVAPQTQSEDLFAALSALVGFAFALNAMLITMPSRRRLIDTVRLQGATDPMIVQILVCDGLVLGVLGCALGLLLGDVLSVVAFHASPNYLAFAFPVGNQRIVSWSSVAIACGAGMAAALGGALWQWRSILTPRSRGVSGRRAANAVAVRLLAAAACLAVTTIVLVFDPALSVVGNVTLVVALCCMLPSFFDAAAAAFVILQRRFGGGPGRVAAAQLRSPQTRVRSLAIAAIAAIAVCATVEFQGTQSNLAHGLRSSAQDIDSNAAVWVSAAGTSNAFATTPFHALSAIPNAIGRLRGVTAVQTYRGGFLDWRQRRLWVLAPPANAREAIPASQFVSGSPLVADAQLREGGWAAISQALAAEDHLRVGETFTLPAPRPTRLRVAALITNLGWPPGAIVIDASDYARAWSDAAPSAYQIQTTPGVSLGLLAHAVRETLGTDTGLVVETVTQREHLHDKLAAQGLSRLTEIRLLVLLAAVLAVAGSTGAAMWQRRDLVATLKVRGYRMSVLLRWLLYESLLTLSVAAVAGAIFGLYGQLLGSHFLATVTGFPVAFDLEATAALWSVLLVAGVTAAIVVISGFLVVRTPARMVAPAY
jgi:putative ABC transport system permease protein